jgi:DNA-directed RNA polymerase subunit RPC12/RpoP
MAFDPAKQSLVCTHCGSTSAVGAAGAVEELDFVAQLQQLEKDEPTHEQLTYKCNGCGVQATLPPDSTAGVCPFCGCAIVAEKCSQKSIKPRSLLPVKVTSKQAAEAFTNWVAGLWFAPSELKRRAERSAIHGAYLPAWTYDSDTDSYYTGERGDDYTETETYTDFEDGKPVTRTREVTKTRWSSVNGRVENRFNDLLVMATASLPPRLLGHLEPWDIANLVPFDDGYLSGFVAESYQVDLKGGFEQAKVVMDGEIRQTINRDIGGDHQRIDTVQTRYDRIKFRHLLLPVWISAYRYGDRTFRFLLNARTGQVRGERPYSALKITLLVLVILVVIAAIVVVSQSAR